MKALVTFKYKDEELQALKDLGYDIIFQDEREFQFSEDMEEAQVLVCFNPFDELNLEDLPNLKWLQVLSAGINQVPLDMVKERGITLSNNRGCYSIPIAEWTVMKVLEMIKNSKEFYEKQEQKLWEMDSSLLELTDKTVGFIGTGSIAEETAIRLKAFGVNLVGVNFTGRENEHFHKIYKIDELDKVIHEFDFLIIAAPYTDKTHHLIDEDVFKAMKDGVYLVNIARGSIIDEEALISNLQSGKVKKAALDVFEEEPLPQDSPLWDLDNVIISPHNSWPSQLIPKRRFEIAYNNMKRYINNEELINVVDVEKGY